MGKSTRTAVIAVAMLLTACLFPSVSDLVGDAGDSPDAATNSVAFIQGTATSFGETATGAVPFPASLHENDAIIVAVTYDNPSATLTVTDSLGSTFTNVVGPITNTTSSRRNYLVAAFHVAGGDDTIIATLNAPPSHEFDVYIHEYAGIGAIDVSAGQVGTSTSMTSGPMIVTGLGDLIFGFGWSNEAVSLGGGFTSRSMFKDNLTEDLLAGAPSTYEATASQSGTSWTMVGAAFTPL